MNVTGRDPATGRTLCISTDGGVIAEVRPVPETSDLWVSPGLVCILKLVAVCKLSKHSYLLAILGGQIQLPKPRGSVDGAAAQCLPFPRQGCD